MPARRVPRSPGRTPPSAKEPRHYFDLHRLALGEWRRLLDDLDGRLDARFAGAVEWQPPGAGADALRAALRRHQAWGSPAHEVDADALARLVPAAVTGPVGIAVLAPDEGAPDPVATAEALLAAAAERGAEIRRGCALVAAEPHAGGIRAVTGAGELPCDRLVLACGVDTPALAAAFDAVLPLEASAGALVHPAARAARHACRPRTRRAPPATGRRHGRRRPRLRRRRRDGDRRRAAGRGGRGGAGARRRAGPAHARAARADRGRLPRPGARAGRARLRRRHPQRRLAGAAARPPGRRGAARRGRVRPARAVPTGAVRRGA